MENEFDADATPIDGDGSTKVSVLLSFEGRINIHYPPSFHSISF
ncbi:hypothetical protein [Prevotella sp. oral taxon 299]|nr:hypothetical protein [Prevotella sp. oral taxon 299]